MKPVNPNKKDLARLTDKFGCVFEKEFTYWTKRSCGILCVAILLYSQKIYSGTPYGLIREALLENGYAFNNRYGKKDIGWKHQTMVNILNRYGLPSSAKSNLSIATIVEILSQNRWVIASVKAIQGSHLVVINKITQDRKISYYDPTMFATNWYSEKEINVFEFNKIYLGKGIVIKIL